LSGLALAKANTEQRKIILKIGLAAERLNVLQNVIEANAGMLA
jgi:hypothetical protein